MATTASMAGTETPGPAGAGWGLFLQAVVLMPAIRLALQVLSFHQVHSLLNTLLPASSVRRDGVEPPDSGRITETTQTVELASKHTVVGNTCLHRSMTLWWLLGRRGVDSHLRFGVRKDGDHLNAHAWVEHHGTVVNDEPTLGKDYMPLASFPAKGARFMT